MAAWTTEGAASNLIDSEYHGAMRDTHDATVGLGNSVAEELEPVVLRLNDALIGCATAVTRMFDRVRRGGGEQ